MLNSSNNSPIEADRTDDEAFVGDLFRAITAIDGFTAQTRRTFAMNAHERLAIAALWAEGPMTMTDLGSWIPLSRAAVTTLVDRLEDGGYVRRTDDPGDRRRTVVVVQQSALNEMIPVLDPWAQDVLSLARSFDDAEWGPVARFLEGLRTISIDHASRLKQLPDEELRSLVVREA
jgi:DNA-binding MarR family transcriptional regulator